MSSENTIRRYLDELSSGSPAPGGGSVAALAGAASAALVSMVAKLTLGRKNFLDAESSMKECIAGAETLRERLALSIEEDTEAFLGLVAAYRFGRENPKPNESCNAMEAQREKKIQDALERTIRVPFSVAEGCVEILRCAAETAEKGNPNAITDAGVAALMADAALKGALLNVRINLRSLKDEGRKNEILDSMRNLLERGRLFLDRALSAVEAKVG